MFRTKFVFVSLVLVLVVAAVWTVPATLTAQAGSGGTIRGTIRSADGSPMEGVVVSARSSSKTFTTSVFSDREGRYAFPPLDPGQYKIWAQAVGFEAARAEFALTGGGSADQNLTLRPITEIRQIIKQLSGTEMLLSLPDETLEDKRGKRLVANNCTGCHTASWVLQNRWDAQGWGNIIDLMTVYPSHGDIPTIAEVNDRTQGAQVMRAYRDEMAQYLGRVRGATELTAVKTLPRPTGEAAQVVITEFDLPRTDNHRIATIHDGTDWSLGTPTRWVGRAAHDIWIDPDGMIWVADDQVPLRTTAKLDPRTGKVTDYYLKDEHGKSYFTHSVAGDAKGLVWLGSRPDDNFLLFNPKTEQFTRFPRPNNFPVTVGGTIAVDSKGIPWAVTTSGAVKMDPATGTYTYYPSPSKGGGYGVIVDRKDNAWHTQPGIERVVKVDARTGDSYEVVFKQLERPEVTALDRERVTLRANQNSAPPQQQAPRRMSADPNNDFVWVSLYTGNRIARIDINTLAVREWALPNDFSQPYANTTDKDGNVWINAMNMDRIVKFDPKTERFTEYQLPTLGTEIRHILADNTTDPPTIWAPYNRSNKIVRLQFRTATRQSQVR